VPLTWTRGLSVLRKAPVVQRVVDSIQQHQVQLVLRGEFAHKPPPSPAEL
jgi:hypothetical protein